MQVVNMLGWLETELQGSIRSVGKLQMPIMCGGEEGLGSIVDDVVQEPSLAQHPAPMGGE